MREIKDNYIRDRDKFNKLVGSLTHPCLSSITSAVSTPQRLPIPHPVLDKILGVPSGHKVFFVRLTDVISTTRRHH